ncbi:hypothetical protein GCM10010885_00880 [Alicyclobacillus cellulosilyticus]|uniref:Uncharacterized protein n=1 Tax=Alicyclobacillus cellulosilyticus TaxID=1003997 RepID=A0A917K2G1_9BACL|nr:hypothetical protein [Alicyclobacillus cellulosilyticus]GGI95077.1 hypothetical protein GCM10010885_00880 [Alicyclobacillus cellulosilyticus]
MADTLLIGVWAWTAIALRRAHPRLILLLLAAAGTGFSVVLHISDWFIVHVVPPASPVWRWWLGKLQAAWTARKLAPLPVSAGLPDSWQLQLWAYHTAELLFTAGAVLAVVCSFCAVHWLLLGLYDEPAVHHPVGWKARWVQRMLAHFAAAVVTVVTSLLLASVVPLLPAWMAPWLDQGWGVQGAAWLARWLTQTVW